MLELKACATTAKTQPNPAMYFVKINRTRPPSTFSPAFTIKSTFQPLRRRVVQWCRLIKVQLNTSLQTQHSETVGFARAAMELSVKDSGTKAPKLAFINRHSTAGSRNSISKRPSLCSALQGFYLWGRHPQGTTPRSDLPAACSCGTTSRSDFPTGKLVPRLRGRSRRDGAGGGRGVSIRGCEGCCRPREDSQGSTRTCSSPALRARVPRAGDTH